MSSELCCFAIRNRINRFCLIVVFEFQLCFARLRCFLLWNWSFLGHLTGKFGSQEGLFQRNFQKLWCFSAKITHRTEIKSLWSTMRYCFWWKCVLNWCFLRILSVFQPLFFPKCFQWLIGLKLICFRTFLWLLRLRFGLCF